MPADTSDKTLMQTATRMLDAALNDGAGYDNIINLLALLCMLSILNRNQPIQQTIPSVPANPLQKLLGELSKGEGGPSPDALMSLLPLLNNPQIKSKLNPSTMGAIFSLLNNMGNSGEKTDSKEKADNKHEKQEKAQSKPEQAETKNDLPAAAIAQPETQSENPDDTALEAEKRQYGRYLNWKSSF